jgi:hypothetical protein
LPLKTGHRLARLAWQKSANRRHRPPGYSINSLASASKLGGNAIPSAFAVLEIDNNLKSHVQQRPPGVIFRLEVLGLLPAQLTHSRTAATC